MKPFTAEELEFEVKNIITDCYCRGKVVVVLYCNDNRVPKLDIIYEASVNPTRQELREMAISQYNSLINQHLDTRRGIKIGDKL